MGVVLTSAEATLTQEWEIEQMRPYLERLANEVDAIFAASTRHDFLKYRHMWE